MHSALEEQGGWARMHWQKDTCYILNAAKLPQHELRCLLELSAALEHGSPFIFHPPAFPCVRWAFTPHHTHTSKGHMPNPVWVSMEVSVLVQCLKEASLVILKLKPNTKQAKNHQIKKRISTELLIHLHFLLRSVFSWHVSFRQSPLGRDHLFLCLVHQSQS